MVSTGCESAWPIIVEAPARATAAKKRIGSRIVTLHFGYLTITQAGWTERNQANDGRDRDQKRIAHFPAEQTGEGCQANQRCQPIADGDTAEQNAGAENCASTTTNGRRQ